MAKVEVMDEDNLLSDFDNKENSLQISNVFSDDKENTLQNSNVFSRTPCTEKGHEELDVSELNMKLRYSVTPASSPMSQSFNINCMLKGDVDANNLNNTIIKDNLLKPTKIPLQALQTGQFTDHKNMSSLKQNKESNDTFTVTGNYDNLSLPSTSSSTVQTPEATTPTKEIPKTDSGSPIMRGLKSVLNMFIPSYTPTSSEILPSPEAESTAKDDVSGILSASTPMASCKIKDNSSKRSSPLKESVIFNNDLERELQWKDDTTINFEKEKTSIHKALFQTVSSNTVKELEEDAIDTREINTTIVNTNVSNLDVSYKSSVEDRPANIDPKVALNSEANATESDSEFLDCETIYSKNESYVVESFENFHKIMPLVVDTSQTGLESYVEDPVNPTIYKKDNYNNTAESVVPIVESQSNHTVSEIFEAKESTCLSDVKLKDDLINLPMSIDILTDPKGAGVQHINDVDKSLQVNIQTINLPSDLSNEDNLNFRNDNNMSTMANSVTPKNICYNRVESLEKSVVLELHENMTDIEPMEHTIITSDITEESIPSNNLCVSMSVEDNKSFTELIQGDKSYELCVKQINETNNSDIGAMNNDIEINQILEIQKSKYSTNLISENNIITEFLDQDDTLFNICTTDIGSINNESNVECGTDTKVLNATFVSEDFVHHTNTQETNINLNEENNVCKIVNIIPNDSVNEIKEKNVLLNVELTSADVSKDSKIQKNHSPEFKDINSSHLESSENYSKNNLEGVTIIMETQNGKMVNDTSHVIYDSDYKIIDKLDFPNVNCDDKSVKLKNMQTETSDNEDKITEMDCELGLDTFSTSKDCILDAKYHTVSVEDIKMNNLDIDSSRKNINYIQNEMGCQILEKDAKFPLLELKNSLHFDIPLPNDEIEKKKLIDDHSTEIIPDSILLANEDIQQQVKATTNTDFTTKLVTLPDIIQAASEAAEKENLDLQKSITRDISHISEAIEDNVKVVNEEISMSTNNSLYVPCDMPTEKIHNKFELKTNKKGYNINFDEIDNPFATKTNIRMSPPPKTLVKSPFESFEQKNFENINSGYTEDITKIAISSPSSQNTVELPTKSEFDDINDQSKISKSLALDSGADIKVLVKNIENNNSPVRKHLDGENSKNVFNLPEIGGSDFNPFKTMSRICPSAPQIQGPKDTLLSENNRGKSDSTCGSMDQIKPANASMSNEDNIYCDKDLSIVSSTAKNSDEVHTEDDDTIEGPFIETDDPVDVIRISDIDVEKDVMQFEDLPTALNNEDDVNGELFIDAETFDFLLNQNKGNIVADSGKESLFLKFDPLFANKVSSDCALAALGSIQQKKGTPNKLNLIPSENAALEQTFDASSSVAPLSEANDALLYLDEMGNSVCKPMMVVNPAVNSNVTPKKSTTSNTNRGSSTIASPAMLVIDRLLSQSDNTTLLDQDDLMPHTRKSHDANIVLTQLREHLAEKQVHVHNLKREANESRERLLSLELQVKSMENEQKERLRRINDLNEHLSEKTKSNKTMAAVVEEYERTIATLIAETEQERRQNAKERAKLINERDEQSAHLTNMERSISDLHSKYEKSKQTVLSMKAKQDAYKKPLKEFDDNFLKMQNNYEQLKQYATSKLNSANQELDEINKAHLKKVAKLTAMIKRKNLDITALEESITQKTKVNEKLTAICDELIK